MYARAEDQQSLWPRIARRRPMLSGMSGARAPVDLVVRDLYRSRSLRCCQQVRAVSPGPPPAVPRGAAELPELKEHRTLDCVLRFHSRLELTRAWTRWGLIRSGVRRRTRARERHVP